MLELIDRWLDQYHDTAWECIYTRDHGRAQAQLGLAQEALAQRAGSDDELAAIKLALAALDYEVADAFAPDDSERRRLLEGCLDRLQEADPQGPLESTVRARLLLTMRALAHLRGVRGLPAAEAEMLWRAVPREDTDHKMASYCAFWAFNTPHHDILRQCYRFFLTAPIDFMVDFSRQRVRVMLSIVEGHLEAQELEELIGLMPHPLHLEWFMQHLYPACRRHGCWSHALEMQLKYKAEQLQSNPPQPPPRDKPRFFKVFL